MWTEDFGGRHEHSVCIREMNSTATWLVEACWSEVELIHCTATVVDSCFDLHAGWTDAW